MAEQNRNPREAMSRESEFVRGQSWAPASLLPDIKPHPGWAYRWVRTSMIGQADAMNVSSKMREGWEPVKLSDHPEVHLYGDNSQSRFKDCIEVGGLLLCKTPEEFVDQRNGYYRKQTQNQTDAVDNNFMKENDARMPLFKDKRSEVSFGSGNK